MYSLETDQDAVAEVAALPAAALGHYAEVMALLEVAPWSGDAYNRQRPAANMRAQPFGRHGEGLVVYLILEGQRRVVVLRAFWLD